MNSRMRIGTCSKTEFSSKLSEGHLDQQTPEGQRAEALNIMTTTKNISLNVNVNLSTQKLRQKLAF